MEDIEQDTDEQQDTSQGYHHLVPQRYDNYTIVQGRCSRNSFEWLLVIGSSGVVRNRLRCELNRF